MNKTTYPGRQPGGKGFGPGGDCYCPKCGYTTSHDVGVPCYEKTCPQCGTGLVRQTK